MKKVINEWEIWSFNGRLEVAEGLIVLGVTICSEIGSLLIVARARQLLFFFLEIIGESVSCGSREGSCSGTSMSGKSILGISWHTVTFSVGKWTRRLLCILESGSIWIDLCKFAIPKFRHNKPTCLRFHFYSLIIARSWSLLICFFLFHEINCSWSHGKRLIHSGLHLIFVLTRSRNFVHLRDKIWSIWGSISA